MKIGYIRVSTDDQELASQVDQLMVAGCERIYQEKRSGNSAKERPELHRMMDAIRDGDVVVVTALDRLGRSLKDLILLMEQFRECGVQFVSLSEAIDTTTPAGELAFHMFGAVAQFHNKMNRERTIRGLASARARGRVGGRKPALTKTQIRQAQHMLLDETVTVTSVAGHFGVARSTLYKALKDADPLVEGSLL
nr:recombinase family protein [uncultured Ferrimonas sp.]